MGLIFVLFSFFSSCLFIFTFEILRLNLREKLRYYVVFRFGEALTTSALQCWRRFQGSKIKRRFLIALPWRFRGNEHYVIFLVLAKFFSDSRLRSEKITQTVIGWLSWRKSCNLDLSLPLTCKFFMWCVDGKISCMIQKMFPWLTGPGNKSQSCDVTTQIWPKYIFINKWKTISD